MNHESYNRILNHDLGIVNTGIVNDDRGMAQTLGTMIKARLYPNTPLKAKTLADRIRRSPSYVSQLANDQKAETPPPDVLAALERELGIPQVVMLRAWGYDIPESERNSPFDYGTAHAKVVEYLRDLNDTAALEVARFCLFQIKYPIVSVPVVVAAGARR